MKWIVVAGTPVEGFVFHGPFDTNAEAYEYAQGFMTVWCVAELVKGDE